MKALCIGRSIYYFNLNLPEFAKNSETLESSDVVESSSGSAVNVARTLGKYGIETYVASVVGDDTFGNIIKKDLEKVGVHTEYMETSFDKRTALMFSQTKNESKEKHRYIASKEKMLLKKTDFPMDPDIIYIDGYDYGASLAALNKYSDKVSILNARTLSQETIELSKYCKYIVVSKEFAEWVTGMQINFDDSSTLVGVYSKLLNKFIGKQIFITLGDKGALYIKDNQIKVMPGLKLEKVDDTGAIDVFIGALGYAILKGYDSEKAVTFANIAGGLSVTKNSPKDSMVDLSEIMKYFSQKYPDESAEPVTTESL